MNGKEKKKGDLVTLYKKNSITTQLKQPSPGPYKILKRPGNRSRCKKLWETYTVLSPPTHRLIHPIYKPPIHFTWSGD